MYDKGFPCCGLKYLLLIEKMKLTFFLGKLELLNYLRNKYKLWNYIHTRIFSELYDVIVELLIRWL